jgi:hypothetical protein
VFLTPAIPSPEAVGLVPNRVRQGLRFGVDQTPEAKASGEISGEKAPSPFREHSPHHPSRPSPRHADNPLIAQQTGNSVDQHCADTLLAEVTQVEAVSGGIE